ncbi:MAG: GumC family protein [Planctomycetota bacterium]
MSDPNLIQFRDVSPSSGDPTEEMDLLYYLQVLRKHRFLVGGGVLASVLVASVVSLLLPRVYEATATILPISRSSPSRLSSVLSNLGTLADLQGLSEAVPEEGSDLLVNVLESRTIASDLIEKENLLPHLFPSRFEKATGLGDDEASLQREAVKLLREEILSISDNNRGLITVSAKFSDPEMAARICNAAVASLQTFLKGNKVSAAARTRAFLSDRITELGKELATAEETLRHFCEKNGVISIPDQTRLLFEQIADLSSEVALKRARVEVMEKFGGSSHPDITRLKAEIQSLQKEITDLERGTKRNDGPLIQSNGFIPLYHVPEKSLQYSRLLRDVRVKQEVFGFLQKESEAAKIRLCSEEFAFTILDPATPPRDPVRPKPVLIISLAAIFSALATFMLAAFLEYLGRHHAR